MILLGLNGWADGTHDPSAALVVNGRLTAFVEEERVRRRRHALSQLPTGAATAVLRSANLSLNDVDVVAYGWDLPKYYARHGRTWELADRDFIRMVTGIEPDRGRVPEVVWVPHHDAHAASAFYASGMDEAAVLVCDGQGEIDSVTLYRGSPSGLHPLRSWQGRQSLGLFYEAATVYCGFGFLDTGKTMGLSAYGRSHEPPPIRWIDDDIYSPVPFGIEEIEVRKFWLQSLVEQFGAPPAFDRPKDQMDSMLLTSVDNAMAHRPNVAAHAQSTVETLTISLAEYAMTLADSRRLCMAGGVALNCVTNGMLMEKCEQLYVQPAANDAGVSIGAAYKVAADRGEHLHGMTTIRLGHCFDRNFTRAFLRERCHFSVAEPEDPAAFAVERLLADEIVGWFDGAMEGGPRALGGRSILALPAKATVKDSVNAAKGREPWRPLAPSLLREEMPRMFGRDIDAPYMLLSLPLTSDAVDRAPAVAHVDGTSRPHTVPRGEGNYRRLLELVQEATGIGVVLNTSFNGPGEPIVCSPLDAVRTFAASGIDTLVIDGLVVTKKRVRNGK